MNPREVVTATFQFLMRRYRTEEERKASRGEWVRCLMHLDRKEQEEGWKDSIPIFILLEDVKVRCF